MQVNNARILENLERNSTIFITQALIFKKLNKYLSKFINESLIEIQNENDLNEIFGKSGFEVTYYIKILECF